MSQAVGGLIADAPVRLVGASVADVSYPDFWRDLEVVSGNVG